LLRAGDDPLRARELQGFRFRAAARPGAACSYAMQEQALGGLSARTRRRLCGPEPNPVRRRRQRAARLTPPVTGDLAWKKSLESLSQKSGFLRPTERVCRSGIGPEPEDTMTLYIIRGDRVAAYASAPARLSLSSSNPNVLVMQTAKMRLCEDPTDVLNFAWNRRVFVQRQMRAGLVVICHVG